MGRIMRQFSELPYYEQTVLVLRMVQLVAERDTFRSIEDVAAAHETSPRLLWLKICASEGLQACEPWEGFPNYPKTFLTIQGKSSEREANLRTSQLCKQLERLASPQ
jgi:hypothetical protein